MANAASRRLPFTAALPLFHTQHIIKVAAGLLFCGRAGCLEPRPFFCKFHLIFCLFILHSGGGAAEGAGAAAGARRCYSAELDCNLQSLEFLLPLGGLRPLRPLTSSKAISFPTTADDSRSLQNPWDGCHVVKIQADQQQFENHLDQLPLSMPTGLATVKCEQMLYLINWPVMNCHDYELEIAHSLERQFLISTL